MMARPRRQAARPTKAQKILDDVEKRRKEAEREGLSFTAPTEEQLRRKLRRAKSPMIVYQAWNGLGAAAGGQINYEVGIHNPDPTEWIWLFMHVFVGPGNMVTDTGEALAPVDERFARLTQPQFPGLTIASGATEPLNFSFEIPATIERTNYLGNSFLFQSVWHDTGQYIDRAVFSFEVT
jgi:hypothetical protein